MDGPIALDPGDIDKSFLCFAPCCRLTRLFFCWCGKESCLSHLPRVLSFTRPVAMRRSETMHTDCTRDSPASFAAPAHGRCANVRKKRKRVRKTVRKVRRVRKRSRGGRACEVSQCEVFRHTASPARLPRTGNLAQKTRGENCASCARFCATVLRNCFAQPFLRNTHKSKPD